MSKTCSHCYQLENVLKLQSYLRKGYSKLGGGEVKKSWEKEFTMKQTCGDRQVDRVTFRGASLLKKPSLTINKREGGPGSTGLFGLLKENGPFLVDVDMDGLPFSKLNPYSWNKNYSGNPYKNHSLKGEIENFKRKVFLLI